MSSRRSLTEGMSFGALSFTFSVTLAVATSILIARLYGIQVVGEFALATAPVGALWFLSTVREQPAFVRVIARMSPRDTLVTGVFAAVFTFSSVLSLVAALVVTGGTYLLYQGPIGQPDLFLPAVAGLAGYVLVTNPSWNLDSVFVAFGDGRRLFWIRGHQSVAFLVLIVALSFTLPTVWGLVVATIGSWTTPLIRRVIAVSPWMRFRAGREDLRAGFRELPEMIRFGLKLTPGSMASGVSGQITIWVLGAVTSVAAVGAFSRATSISRRFMEFNMRIREMLFPALVTRRADGDGEAFTRALTDSIRYVMVGLLLPASVLGGASVSVMALFGEEFEFAAPALAIAMIGPALMGTNGLRAAAVTAIDKPFSATIGQVGGMLTKAATIVPLTLSLGITGAAISGLIGPFMVNLWLARVIRRHLKLRATQVFPPRQVASLAVAYAGGFGAAALLQDVLVQPLGLVLALLGGTAAYAATYVAVGGPTERDRHRFRVNARRLHHRLGGRQSVAGAA